MLGLVGRTRSRFGGAASRETLFDERFDFTLLPRTKLCEIDRDALLIFLTVLLIFDYAYDTFEVFMRHLGLNQLQQTGDFVLSHGLVSVVLSHIRVDVLGCHNRFLLLRWRLRLYFLARELALE